MATQTGSTEWTRSGSRLENLKAHLLRSISSSKAPRPPMTTSPAGDQVRKHMRLWETPPPPTHTHVRARAHIYTHSGVFLNSVMLHGSLCLLSQQCHIFLSTVAEVSCWNQRMAFQFGSPPSGEPCDSVTTLWFCTFMLLFTVMLWGKRPWSKLSLPFNLAT